jgi:hypothetical protein
MASAGVAGASAQERPVLTLDASARGMFDSNASRTAVPLDAYGGGGDLLLRVANRLRAPTLQLEYAASLRHSSPSHVADGAGHRASALVRAPLAGWLRVELIGRGRRGGTDEDLVTGDELLLASRVELQPVRATRVRGYGAYRWRAAPTTEAPSVGQYGGVELRQRIGRSTTLLGDARYERFQPPDSSRDWQRLALLFGVGQSVFRNTAVEADVRFREREYPGRLVALEDGAAPRRDTDRRYGVALVYDNGTGTELRLELERDRRQSNDVRRAYAADRATLVVRQRLFALGSRRDPPRIDESPAMDALRRAGADGSPSGAGFTGVLVAGTGMCAIGDQGALCWPAPTAALAAGTPALVSGRWQRVAAAEGRACGLDADGRVHCWAWRTGSGGASAVETRPQPLRSDMRFVEIAVGFAHACALTVDGAAYCWGENGDGQLGTGLATPATRPAAVVGGLRFWTITAGVRHTCALDLAGTAYCWGANESGQAGAGTLRRSLRPKPIDGHTFTTITAGASHTCALSDPGRAHCWGESGRGQAGAAGGMVAAPLQIATDVAFATISAGWAHTCALTGAGRAYCWGANRYGQLGTGGIDGDAHPQPVPVAGGSTFVDVSASFRTCALEPGGQLYCWGGAGQDPTADARAARPRRVPMATAR